MSNDNAPGDVVHSFFDGILAIAMGYFAVKLFTMEDGI